MKQIELSKNQIKIVNAYSKLQTTGKPITSAAIAKIAKVARETARINVLKLKALKVIK
jgi:hypothetical protein